LGELPLFFPCFLDTIFFFFTKLRARKHSADHTTI
jgi:hypothetical protein